MEVKDLVTAVCGTIVKVVIVALLVSWIYKGATLAYDYGYRIFEEPPVATGEGRSVTVTIPEGMSAKEMGNLFLQKGLIRDADLFQLQYMLSEFKKDIKPGTFELSTAMTAEEMMEAMTMEQAEGAE